MDFQTVVNYLIIAKQERKIDAIREDLKKGITRFA